MRTRFFLQLGWLAAAANCAFCGEANDPTPVSQERLRALVQQLGADSFEQRDAAQEELARAGERALEVLEAAQKGSDPEIRVRVLRLLQPLRFRAASLVEWKTMQELLGPLLGAKTLDAPAPAAAAKVSPNARAAPDPSLQWLAEAQENDGHWDSRSTAPKRTRTSSRRRSRCWRSLGRGTPRRGATTS
ncbi:MAG: hypothetical protein NTW87_19170 [Planctomycetota bacterium]|nr:hypothetical protein [Planctomycetota bacterium]